MTVRNTVPKNFELTLISVLDETANYFDVLLPIFKTLNPSRVTSLCSNINKGIWTFESQVFDLPWRVWSQIPTHISSKLKRRGEVAALYSVSSNGHVRELAVKSWTRVDSSFELALLLQRLNDWVPQVRDAALLKIEELMRLPVEVTGLTNEIILGCMDLILNPLRFGRSREIEFKVLNQLTNINEMPITMSNFVSISRLDSAPRYLKLGLRRGIFSDALPDMSKNASHPDVRRIATKALLDSKVTWKEKGEIRTRYIESSVDLDLIAKTALLDSSAAVQSIALDYISEMKPASLFKEVTYRKFTNNRRMSLVERAIYGLKHLGVDFVDETRQEIALGNNSTHLLRVLGKFGSSSDGALIFDGADKLSIEDEIRALGAAAKLGHAPAVTKLESIAFENPDDDIARLAINRIPLAKFSPDPDRIVHAIEKSQNVVLRGYMRLFQKLPTMKLALVMSEAMLAGIDYDFEIFWRLLSKKRNMGAFLPTDEEIKALRKSVENSDELKKKFFGYLGV